MKKHKVEENPEQKEPKAEQQITQEAEMTAEETAAQIIADIESLNQEVSELKDKNLRLMAEFDNFRKRSLKERVDLMKYAGEEVLQKILPLVDDFEQIGRAHV